MFSYNPKSCYSPQNHSYFKFIPFFADISTDIFIKFYLSIFKEYLSKPVLKLGIFYKNGNDDQKKFLLKYIAYLFKSATFCFPRALRKLSETHFCE